MTKGVTDETVDGMSIQKIDRMIELLREEKYQWKPARREYIPKKNGKKRPLGIPTWGDKLLQEVMREILEAYYEPQFSNHSHGFRPNRGCHTALQEIQIWKGTRWFIEGDISKYFDTIDHDVLLKILEKNIHDGRFLRLISNMLKAGYLDDWKFNQTISGTPQGGVISPLLANIYLNEFDQWLENTLIPQYTKGKRQKSNPAYNRMNAEISKARKNRDIQTAHKLEVERRNIPSVDPYDENYRRCRYVRYADDFLIGFTGSKADAEEIKAAMHNFLENELHLELSQEKTLITNASSQAAKFLGYKIKAQRANDYIDPKGRRGANGAIALLVPAKVIESKCQSFKRNGKVTHRNALLQDDDFSIVQQFQAEYRGLVQYYILAQNLSWFSTRLSLALTTIVLVQVVRQPLRGLCHRVDVHAVGPGADHAPQAAGAKRQVAVKGVLDLRLIHLSQLFRHILISRGVLQPTGIFPFDLHIHPPFYTPSSRATLKIPWAELLQQISLSITMSTACFSGTTRTSNSSVASRCCPLTLRQWLAK